MEGSEQNRGVKEQDKHKETLPPGSKTSYHKERPGFSESMVCRGMQEEDLEEDKRPGGGVNKKSRKVMMMVRARDKP